MFVVYRLVHDAWKTAYHETRALSHAQTTAFAIAVSDDPKMGSWKRASEDR